MTMAGAHPVSGTLPRALLTHPSDAASLRVKCLQPLGGPVGLWFPDFLFSARDGEHSHHLHWLKLDKLLGLVYEVEELSGFMNRGLGR